jgi:hypothetical protein
LGLREDCRRTKLRVIWPNCGGLSKSKVLYGVQAAYTGPEMDLNDPSTSIHLPPDVFTYGF